MLKRKIYDELVAWKSSSNGTTAMMIDGARRVGKSYIAEAFAKAEYKSYILIDFGRAPTDVLDLFANDSSDLDLFFAKLAALYATPLHRRESRIIFDEVQQYPRARQLIKYLVADGRFDYLETGSLIRLKKNVQDIIIPSEEDHIEMFPLDFEEFLWAMGDEATYPLIRHCFELAAYRVNRQADETLEDYLNARVFAGAKGSTIRADAADEAGLDAYTARFHQALSAEKAAIADMD